MTHSPCSVSRFMTQRHSRGFLVPHSQSRQFETQIEMISGVVLILGLH